MNDNGSQRWKRRKPQSLFGPCRFAGEALEAITDGSDSREVHGFTLTTEDEMPPPP